MRYHRTRGEKYPERDAAENLEKEKRQIDEVASEENDLPVLGNEGLSGSISKQGGYMGLPLKLRYEQSQPRDSITGSRRHGDRSSGNRTGSSRRRDEAAIKTHATIPASIPYTTPASEFIYGTSAIRSALRCYRRKLYKLYVYDGMLKQAGTTRDDSLSKLALINGIQVKNVAGDWIRLLDKMSSGRPHNGYILEASPLPKLPILNYEPVDSPTAGYFPVTLGHQSREEEEINGTNNRIPSLGTFTSSPTGSPTQHRYPFTLLLDGILDPGNLGAVIRSAYYLGVDAITFAARNSAPFSPVTIKSSAGAAENIPLLSVINTVQFIDTSRANGWRFFAAEAPGSASSKRAPGQRSRAQVFPTQASMSELSQALTESPCVLMLGGEGLGLSSNLRKRADTFIGIPGARMGNPDGDIAGVDSLNVSVASALLCEAFLRGPTDRVASSQDTPEPVPSLPEATIVYGETQASAGNAEDTNQEPDPEDGEKLF